MASVRLYQDESVAGITGEGVRRRGVPILTARDAENPGVTDAQQL